MTLFLCILLAGSLVLAAFGWISAWGREDQVEALRERLAAQQRLRREAESQAYDWKQRAVGNIRVVETLLDETRQLESAHTQTVEMLLEEQSLS